ncbi:hypothetical protein [Microbacterium thalassium]|uniref:Nucleotidyltransferase domain-containing protein n=1 Tax=Microbacterium thalassium TaxID=362649 RepID=A0A7X0FSH7_9MICO|nr:hypothetical protein [Microbacterium thalassium]MBB6392908.1 hypothetical protein [Microbacterium thalassium]GLK22861.1 hypothetical protein GCM10017607_01790 [Microbacterium thalassium]
MATPERFDALSRGLAEGVAQHPDLVGLALMGSASDEAAARRDEWSDHDFFAIIGDGRAGAVRSDLSWLPDQPALALLAREGEVGFVAVYDDGHVMEFAFAEASELSGALAGEATVVVDDAAHSVAELVERSRERAAAGDRFDAANDARLVLVKLLIGVGRARRGEVLVAGQFVRWWAVQHLIRAVRGRHPERSGAARDRIDPARRFERDFPEWADRIARAVAQDVEPAARELFALLGELEPGWPEFPGRAADAVSIRLGWGRDSDATGS